jgi:hypothetical protein
MPTKHEQLAKVIESLEDLVHYLDILRPEPLAYEVRKTLPKQVKELKKIYVELNKTNTCQQNTK